MWQRRIMSNYADLNCPGGHPRNSPLQWVRSLGTELPLALARQLIDGKGTG